MNNDDKDDKYVCPSFKDNCVKPNYDPSIEAFMGIIYSAILCVLFWIGIFYLIRWIR
jgi:hypothetical protein